MKHIFAFIILLGLTLNTEAQEKYFGKLELIDKANIGIFRDINFYSPNGDFNYLDLRNIPCCEIQNGNICGDVKIEIEKVDTFSHQIKMRIDVNNNKNIMDDDYFFIDPDSSKYVYITKRYPTNKIYKLRFKIRNIIKRNESKIVEHKIRTMIEYKLKGTVTLKGITFSTELLDFNFDGNFDKNDNISGTNLWLDLNKNNTYDRGEWFRSDKLIQTDFGVFTARIPNKDGSIIIFTETNINAPKIGDMFPSFSLFATNGKTINNKIMKGNIYLIDFWASWCGWCIDDLKRVKLLKDEFGSQLKIISINVDEIKSKDKGKAFLDKFSCSDYVILNNDGIENQYWKIWGSINKLSRYSIPAYFLIDQKGKIIYFGRGLNNSKKGLHIIRDKIIEILN